MSFDHIEVEHSIFSASRRQPLQCRPDLLCTPTISSIEAQACSILMEAKLWLEP